MDMYDRDDSLDRAPYLMNDHDDYNTYSLDWPENVFGEEIPGSDDPAAPAPAPDGGDVDSGDEPETTDPVV